MLKRITYVMTFIFAFALCTFAQNVTVNPGGGSYATLTDAFNAINAGTHTGAVTVNIAASTTEPAGSAVLNSSGIGSASYTSVVIRPTADGVTVSGAPIQGRGVIELNGADNVTIDGDNAGTAGVNRNLTIVNAAADTVRFSSVLRIALATTGTGLTEADNVSFKNLVIVGNAQDKNSDAFTSTAGSQFDAFGIVAGPGAGAAGPAAITSVTTGIAAGASASNLLIENNSISTAARGVSIQSTVTTVFTGLQIVGNTIGNPVAGDPDQVYAIGITAQGGTTTLIARNTIYIEGYLASSSSTHAISIGLASSAGAGTATIEKNKILRVKNSNVGTWSAYGVNIAGGSSHVIRNNFIAGVINDQTAGTGGFGTTFGAYGIRIASGTGHQVYHNSVHLYGAMGGVVSTNSTSAFVVTSNTLTGIDVRNNIFSNQITGGNPIGTRNVAIMLPSAGSATNNLTLNNNAYYVSSDDNARLAQTGTTFGAGEFAVADFDPTATSPATNFRAYSSTLSAAGTNDNASFATTTPPPFVSNTDLHIPAGTATRLESGGADVDVADDIDNEARHATLPDIGADEFAGAPPAANDIAAGGILVPENGTIVSNTTSVTPQATFSNQGTAVQTNVSVRFTITGPGGYNYVNTSTIPTINPLQSVTVTFAATPAFTTVGTYNMTSEVVTADSVPGNNSRAGTFEVRNPVSGTISIGKGGAYTSLTNVGGLFDDINTIGALGAITINITSDLTAETGAVALQQMNAGASLTIKPSGGARQIVSSTNTPTSLIRFHGADNVTIDGSLNGGTDRSLTIVHGSTAGTVIWLASNGAGDGVSNITIKNCIITGKVGSVAIAGVLSGSGVTLGNDAEAPHNNNSLINNEIYRVQNAAYLRGNVSNFDQNWTVSGNRFGSDTIADKNSFRGMLIGHAQNFMITNNIVRGIQSSASTTAAMNGIQVALLVNGGSIIGNQISDIKNVSGSGTGAFGITISTTSTASNLRVANNFVSDIAGAGSATVNSNGHGIMITGGGGYEIYFNSVNMNTNQTSGTTSALNIGTGVPAGAVNLRNNILANTQTGGAARFSVFSASPAATFSTINYNDYFSTGNVGSLAGTIAITLANWQAATGQDANSVAVDPVFVSPTDLHLQPTTPLAGAGTSIAGYITDIDGENRGTPPEIGADEIGAAISTATISGRVTTPDGRGLRNAQIIVTGGTLSAPIRYITGGFGYFSIPDLPTGQTYVVTVQAKRWTFAQPSRVITLNGDVTDANFVAQ